jgi:hypothetical protein
MIELTTLRTLDLVSGSEPDRPAFLSAASGLVAVGRYLYAVADDELHLGVFDLHNNRPGRLLRLFAGDLPDKTTKRKKAKPDLEALLQLPAFADYPHGALLALGSGSSKRRYRAALLRLEADGSVQGKTETIDTSAWLAPLAAQFGELNIEGAWVSGRQFHLLQRGNKGAGVNAVASGDLTTLLQGLAHDDWPANAPLHIQEFELGNVQDVPLCFSDACALAGGEWLFTAVAEDTHNPRDDGAFVGAAIGRVGQDQQLRWVQAVSPSFKIEGIEVIHEGADPQILLVTDADDPAVPAVLLSARVEMD